MDDTEVEFDDIGTAQLEGRSLRCADRIRFEIGFDRPDFRHAHVTEAVPVGAEVPRAAGPEPTDEISLLAILASGEFEEVLLDQWFDLHGRGAARLVAFCTDRLFKLTLNKRLVL
jgi:hypothetical protein